MNLSPEDWVGAFNGDVCVGSRRWDVGSCSSGICDVPVYGVDVDDPLTIGYMSVGDIPTFKIFDYSDNNFYDVQVVSDEEPWSFLVTAFIETIEVVRDCYNELGGHIFDTDDGEVIHV